MQDLVTHQELIRVVRNLFGQILLVLLGFRLFVSLFHFAAQARLISEGSSFPTTHHGNLPLDHLGHLHLLAKILCSSCGLLYSSLLFEFLRVYRRSQDFVSSVLSILLQVAVLGGFDVP